MFDLQLYTDANGLIGIAELKEDLDRVQKSGATHVESYGISAYVERLETKEEHAIRLATLDKIEAYRTERELLELKRLKKKYEK